MKGMKGIRTSSLSTPLHHLHPCSMPRPDDTTARFLSDFSPPPSDAPGRLSSASFSEKNILASNPKFGVISCEFVVPVSGRATTGTTNSHEITQKNNQANL